MSYEEFPDLDLPPMQMVLDSNSLVRPKISLTCSGLTVVSEVLSGDAEEVVHLLKTLGVFAELSHGFITFPVSKLKLLCRAHRVLEVEPDSTVGPLVEMLSSPVISSVPAVVDVDFSGNLTLQWTDTDGVWERTLGGSAAGALVASGVPFVASQPAWGVLREVGVLPEYVAVAKTDLDGHIKIKASLPQLVEGSPIPGLFKVSASEFGAPARYFKQVYETPGFKWEGPAPARIGNHSITVPSVALSQHQQSGLLDAVNRLSTDEALAFVWEKGLGRRVMALAAVEALDAWPLLVVCSTARVWAWQRHCDLFGRSVATSHGRNDVQVVTYDSLADGVRPSSPAAIVFDDVFSPEASTNAVRRALKMFKGLAGVPRIALASEWPSDPEEALQVMESLRPSEFCTDTPLHHRYPSPAETRGQQHIESYLMRRSQSDASEDQAGFRRSSVAVVSPREAQHRAISECVARGGEDRKALLQEALELVSAGPSSSTSPKIATAARLAQEADQKGRKVAVVTRFTRSGTLLSSMLRHLGVTFVDGGEIPADCSVAVVKADRQIPNLRAFDEVIFLDYMNSSADIDASVGSAASTGPAQVTVVHMAGSLDDRLAAVAAEKKLNREGAWPHTDLSPAEVEYILTGSRTH